MDNIIEGAVVIVGIEAVLVLLLVVSPGLIADWIYRFILCDLIRKSQKDLLGPFY